MPERIATFDLSTLDTLTALGVPVIGVPEVRLPERVALPAEAETIGSLFEPDYEALNALTPDLIVVSGRSAPKYEALSRLAPTVDLTTDPQRYLESVVDNVRLLGTVTGREREAEAEIAALEKAVSELRARSATAGSVMLLMTTGGRISTYGLGSRFGILFTDFGFTPVEAEIATGNHGQPVSFEYVLDKNPDWIFVIDRDAAIGEPGAAARQLLDNAIVARTSAAQNDRIAFLDSTDWYLIGGGVQSLKRTVASLSALLEQD